MLIVWFIIIERPLILYKRPVADLDDGRILLGYFSSMYIIRSSNGRFICIITIGLMIPEVNSYHTVRLAVCTLILLVYIHKLTTYRSVFCIGSCDRPQIITSPRKLISTIALLFCRACGPTQCRNAGNDCTLPLNIEFPTIIPLFPRVLGSWTLETVPYHVFWQLFLYSFNHKIYITKTKIILR